MDGTADDARSPVSASDVLDCLASDPTGLAATALAGRLQAQLGASLSEGRAVLIDELVVAWVIAAPDLLAPPVVRAQIGPVFQQRLTRLGSADIYAAAVRLAPGTAMRWVYELDDAPVGGGSLEVYPTHPDSRPRPEIPTGTLLPQEPWRGEIFAGVVRDWSLYVPAQVDAAHPAAVMIFQDGVRFYQSFAPAVFDTLIASGAMPPTIGIFLDPGVFVDTTVSNRSTEYDTLSDRYARFLLEEILPAVEQRYVLRQDAAGRALCGISSGGICAFTAAWQRPDQFSKVLSHVGSFTNIAAGPTLREGGHNYPFLIRKLPPKPIRVFLQAGENDLNNAHGNWWLANCQMADALQFAGYDYRLVTGQGFHSLAHGQAILPDALRWLWRDA